MVAEVVIRPVVDRHADDGAAQQTAPLQPVERVEGHHLGEVAGDPEDHEHVGRLRGRRRHAELPQGVGETRLKRSCSGPLRHDPLPVAYSISSLCRTGGASGSAFGRGDECPDDPQDRDEETDPEQPVMAPAERCQAEVHPARYVHNGQQNPQERSCPHGSLRRLAAGSSSTPADRVSVSMTRR